MCSLSVFVSVAGGAAGLACVGVVGVCAFEYGYRRVVCCESFAWVELGLVAVAVDACPVVSVEDGSGGLAPLRVAVDAVAWVLSSSCAVFATVVCLAVWAASVGGVEGGLLAAAADGGEWAHAASLSVVWDARSSVRRIQSSSVRLCWLAARIQFMARRSLTCVQSHMGVARTPAACAHWW